MKPIQYLMAGCLLASLAAASSCTNHFEDYNTNPNRMTVGDIEPSRMLEPLIYDASREWQRYTRYWNGELIQYTACTSSNVRQEHRYFIGDQDFKGLWNFYAGYANNTMHMYDLASAKGDVAIEAMALTLKVLFMSNLTDMFGDVPYSEAFQGRKEGGTRKPKYDSQKEVYEQMFADLERANELYATAPTLMDAQLDGLYQGDMQAWRRFNNTLYMRLLCRVGGRPEMDVPSRMRRLLADAETYPLFASNADNARVDYTGIEPYVGYYDGMNANDFTRSSYKITRQVIDMAVVTQNDVQLYEDPRLRIMAEKSGSRWKGTIGGCTNAQQSEANSGAAYLNYAVLGRNTNPSFFMCYDELQFILAEAALKGWIDGGESAARTYYVQAVTASCEKWGEFASCVELAEGEEPADISADDIRELLESELASWDGHADKAKLIGDQKYLALFWIGMEAYHEYRRTGYPELTIGEGTINDHVLPTRFAYPVTSVATNAENVQVALDRMGGANDMKTPVWWSLKAINNN